MGKTSPPPYSGSANIIIIDINPDRDISNNYSEDNRSIADMPIAFLKKKILYSKDVPTKLNLNLALQ